jgi:hypothetical protein
MGAAFPPATYEQFEEPAGPQPVEIQGPLTDFIESSAMSWSYALANRGSWSVLESVGMLGLSYAVGLWLLRWQSAGRVTEQPDIFDVITILDRGQGYAPLAGAKQRRRINVLARLEQIERLLAWYAR